MASAARTASRAFLRSTPATSSFRPAARSARFTLPSQAFRASSRRGFASEAPRQGKSSNGLLWAGLAVAGGAGAYFYLKGGDAKNFVPSQKDYQAVYDEIARKLADETDYDDGSYGPVSYFYCDLNQGNETDDVRLSSVWHGTQAVPTTRKPALEAATAPP